MLNFIKKYLIYLVLACFVSFISLILLYNYLVINEYANPITIIVLVLIGYLVMIVVAYITKPGLVNSMDYKTSKKGRKEWDDQLDAFIKKDKD